MIDPASYKTIYDASAKLDKLATRLLIDFKEQKTNPEPNLWLLTSPCPFSPAIEDIQVNLRRESEQVAKALAERIERQIPELDCFQGKDSCDTTPGVNHGLHILYNLLNTLNTLFTVNRETMDQFPGPEGNPTNPSPAMFIQEINQIAIKILDQVSTVLQHVADDQLDEYFEEMAGFFDNGKALVQNIKAQLLKLDPI